MTTGTEPTIEEARIRERIDRWLEAVSAKDLDGIMANYTPDILSFDAVLQLQFKGADAYREHWKACLSWCEGSMAFKVHDLEITAGDEVAYVHYLNECGGGDAGDENACWMRATICLRKIGGEWMITHEHWSAPFDPESGKTLMNLRP